MPQEIRWDMNVGMFICDDFLNTPSLSADADTAKYAAYIDTSNTITQLATEVTGVVRLALDASDNDECWITAGGNSGVLGVISDTAGADRKMWFECRFRPSSITDHSYFIGLAEEGLAGGDTMVDDTGVLKTTADFIGFRSLAGSPSVLNFVYQKASQTLQTVITTAQTMVASTWYRVGFKYDPSEVTAKRIKIYVDGTEQTTYVTGTNIAAATFPDAEELTFLAGHKNGAATATNLDLDWWQFAQMNP